MALPTAEMCRYVGMGSEGATFGTPAASEFHIDGVSSTLDSPKAAEITIPSGCKRAPRRKIRAYYAPTGTVEYPMDIETIGYNLLYALGEYVYTAGAGTPHTHEFYGGDNIIPRYFTTRVGKDEFEHVFDGCAMNGLTINVGEGILNVTSDIVARRDTPDDITAYSSLLLPEDVPLAFHNVKAYVGTTPADISAKVRTLTLAIKNNIDVNRGRNVGSEYPQRHRFGGLTVDYSMQLEFEDLDMLEAYWGDESGPASAGSTFLNDLKFVFAPHDIGGVTDTRQLDIILPTVDVKNSTISPRESDSLFHDISGTAYIGDVTLVDTTTKISTSIYAKLIADNEAYYVGA